MAARVPSYRPIMGGAIDFGGGGHRRRTSCTGTQTGPAAVTGTEIETS